MNYLENVSWSLVVLVPSAIETSVYYIQVTTTITAPASNSTKWKVGAKEALLMWCRNHITATFGIAINDFGRSWRDGKAFLAIINCIQEGLAKMTNDQWKNNKDRLGLVYYYWTR